MTLAGSRPKCLAGGGPLERRVRPHVCHEHAEQHIGKECGGGWERGALLKMGVGPPEPAIRSGLQTTASCLGKESWW